MSAVISLRIRNAAPRSVEAADLVTLLARAASAVAAFVQPARPALGEALRRDAGLPAPLATVGIDWLDAEARRVRF
ncbi:MAG: hypothetical protein U1E62_00775 [Alsobacter sp.]